MANKKLLEMLDWTAGYLVKIEKAMKEKKFTKANGFVKDLSGYHNKKWGDLAEILEKTE